MENMRTAPEDGVFRFNGREKQKRRESAVSVLKRRKVWICVDSSKESGRDILGN